MDSHIELLRTENKRLITEIISRHIKEQECRLRIQENETVRLREEFTMIKRKCLHKYFMKNRDEKTLAECQLYIDNKFKNYKQYYNQLPYPV